MGNEYEAIYKEDEHGSISESSLEKFFNIKGVWALFGISKETNKRYCLNVGRSGNIGNEVLYDIACLHYVKYREDGIKEYRNQFNEACGFKYKTNQVREYLYPFIALHWHSFEFVLIHDKSDQKSEQDFACAYKAKYWRNGRPFGVKQNSKSTNE